MREYDIHIVFVEWDGGGKHRPVLIIEVSQKAVICFGITTQYKNKSPHIKAKLIPLNDWQAAGLHKMSYVDVDTKIELALSFIDKKPVGTISDDDLYRLIEYLEK